jgi:hypothetical protein
VDPFHEGLVAVFPQIRQFLSRLPDPLELEGIDSARPSSAITSDGALARPYLKDLPILADSGYEAAGSAGRHVAIVSP